MGFWDRRLEFRDMSGAPTRQPVLPSEKDSKTSDAFDFATRIRAATAELRDLEKCLKSERVAPNAPLLFEFRTALDNARMTAWVMSELVNVHQTRIDPHAVSTFLTSERVRRFCQLVRDLCADVDSGEIRGETSGIVQLREALSQLQMRLSRTGNK